MRLGGPFGVRGVRPVSFAPSTGLREIVDLVALQNPTTRLPSPGPPIPGPPQRGYDPVNPAYDHRSDVPAPPAPWFAEAPTSTTPPLASATSQPDPAPPSEPRPPLYEDAVLDQAMMTQLMALVSPSSAPAPDTAPADPASDDPMQRVLLDYIAATDAAHAGDMREVAQAIAEQQMMAEPVSEPFDHGDPQQMMQELYDQQMHMLMNPNVPPGP